MSMRELGKRGTAKGALINPARVAIVAHLKANDEVSTSVLLQAVLNAGVVTEDELARHPYWLQGHLTALRIKGHVHKRINAAQQLVWAAGAEEPQAIDAETTPAVFIGFDFAESADPEVVSELSSAEGKVAAARHINVMHGPVYKPAGWAPARPGALDFVRIESLMGSRRVAYRVAP